MEQPAPTTCTLAPTEDVSLRQSSSRHSTSKVSQKLSTEMEPLSTLTTIKLLAPLPLPSTKFVPPRSTSTTSTSSQAFQTSQETFTTRQVLMSSFMILPSLPALLKLFQLLLSEERISESHLQLLESTPSKLSQRLQLLMSTLSSSVDVLFSDLALPN